MIEGLDGISVRSGVWRAPGVSVDHCFEPGSIDELATVLKAASDQRLALLVIGGGTRLEWANPARQIESGLSTLALTGVDVFEPDEGVLHARAGTCIAEVQKLAGEAGWELPLDPAGMTSTVGGVIASAATGPRALGFGRVADAILGLEVVSAEGAISKCGGRVVKNVTGYDLGKLYYGSFGSLGVLTGAWLRLRPAPALRRARFAPLPRDPLGFVACRALAKRTSLRALVWIEGEGADADEGVYFELGGSEVEVAHDLAAFDSVLSSHDTSVERIDALRDARAAESQVSVVLRARVLGVESEALVREIREAGLAVAVDLGLGVVHARGDVASRDELIRLREMALSRGGFVTFERIPDEWRSGFDVFGETAGSEDLMLGIKQRFDPHGILNPGRFQAGL